MRRRGFATSLQRDFFQPDTLTTDPSSMSGQPISSASRSAISSPVSAEGRPQHVSLDGPMTGRSGLAPVPASRSRSLAKEPVRVTHGICGPTSFASSVPAGPLSSWESRLRDRLAMVGSTEFNLTWRDKVTPAGGAISRLVPSTRHISVAVSGGSQSMSAETAAWATPTVHGNWNRKGITPDAGDGLATQMRASHWPTVKASDGGIDMTKMDRSTTGLSLQTVMAAAAPWSTPRATDGAKGSPNQTFSAGGQPLPAQMHQIAAWNTPLARDGKGSPHTIETMATNSRPLNEQMSVTARMDRGGPEPSGSPATTAKRGVPNPAHPCWLLGYAAEWLCGAGSETPSRRSSARKS